MVHLRFDESSGTLASDSSGNGWNGTLVNGPLWATGANGKINNAVSLDGSNDYLTLPAGVVSSLNDFSMTAWVKWNGGTDWQRAIDFGTGITNYLFFSPRAGSATARFAIRTPAVAEQVIDGPPLTIGVWTHVAVTLSGTTGTLYINGVSVGTNAAMTLKPSSLGSTNLNYLGRSQFPADAYLNGSLDELQIHNRALSAAEIAAIAAPPPAPTGLAATPGNGQVALTWNAAAGATGYQVKRATVSGGPYTTLVSNLAATAYTDTAVTNGTTYYYAITAAASIAESARSADVSATPVAPPPAPAGLTATPGNAQVVLAWNVTAGATSYTVKRSLTSGSGYATIFTGATTGYTDSAVTNGTPYYYVVTASNAGGTSADSAQSAATPVSPPAAPGNLIATGANAQVALSWNAVAGATSYTVKRSTTNGSGYAPINTGWITNYTDTAVSNGTTYYYVVIATNAGGSSGNSTQAIGTPVAPPSPPTALTATGGNAQVTLGWNAAVGATSYTVKRSLTSGSGYATITTIATTGYIDTGLTNGTPYFYVVSATNAGGTSADSTQATATPVSPPAAPGNPIATGTNAQVALTWNAAAGATSYTLKRSTTNGSGYLPINTGATTNYTDTAVSNGTTYYYVVIATNAGGSSGNSTQAIGTPVAPPSPPTALTATGGNTQVTLGWNAAAGATSYTLKRSLTNGSGYTTLTSGPANSYSDTAVTNGTTYYYVVSASNAGGESGNSTQASATPLSAIQAWRLANFGTIDNTGNAADAADPDGDGTSNETEFRLGLDPNNGSSAFKAIGTRTPGGFMLTWPSATGLTFEIRRGSTPGGIGELIGSVIGVGTFTDTTPPSGTSFYRIVLLP